MQGDQDDVSKESKDAFTLKLNAIGKLSTTSLSINKSRHIIHSTPLAVANDCTKFSGMSCQLSHILI